MWKLSSFLVTLFCIQICSSVPLSPIVDDCLPIDSPVEEPKNVIPDVVDAPEVVDDQFEEELVEGVEGLKANELEQIDNLDEDDVNEPPIRRGPVDAKTRTNSQLKRDGTIQSQSASKGNARGQSKVNAGSVSVLSHDGGHTSIGTQIDAESKNCKSKSGAENKIKSKIDRCGVETIYSKNKAGSIGDAYGQGDGETAIKRCDIEGKAGSSGGVRSHGNGSGKTSTRSLTKVLPDGHTISHKPLPHHRHPYSFYDPYSFDNHWF